MRIFLIVCGAILVLALIVLQQSLGMSPADVLAAVLKWPVEQGIATALIAAVLLFLLGAAIWQSDKIAQQTKAIDLLQKRMGSLRDQTVAVDEDQKGLDSAVRHLVGTDPVSTIDDVQCRLSDTETRTSQQAAQNDAVDLQSRIDEIRRRQQALRTHLGTVSDKRRLIEPTLVEVKERQVLIERSLGELEKDENGKSLDGRLADAEAILDQGHKRVDSLESTFGDLKQVKQNMEQLQGTISPLESQDAGLKALFNEVAELQKRVDVALLSLEKDGNESMSDRVERTAKVKREIEKRISALTDSFGSLEGIRQDIGEQFRRLNTTLDGHLNR